MNRVANLSKLMDELILDYKIKLEKEQEHMSEREKALSNMRRNVDRCNRIARGELDIKTVLGI